MMAEEAGAQSGLAAVVDLFNRACDLFGRALARSDDAVLDATDFAGSLHELGFHAGQVQALGAALTVITGTQEWTLRADEVLAEYLHATPLPEDRG